ncbi:hypothetical protein C7974DRAFT_440859 [Boeremia exigua]|uniref:uncharacterized protein n=1 Tax=Boeremia exigua TaxID=749465 RepID=UPI001E8E9151|nr:uncharacterized protein C7974DRAFT_440859 [Boeremia exigua]KAH6618557.1 hypothetical protein C7974DRAFT_440859 [Boeremia exigua]
MTAPPALSAGVHLSSRSIHPQIFRRAFACGHPDEFIEVQLLDDGEHMHNIVTFEVFKQQNRGESRPVFVESRCLGCAQRAKDEDDRDASLRPKRALSAYRAGTSSTSRTKISQDGFLGALERYRDSSGQDQNRRPHPRVSEEEHQAHRLKVLSEAVDHPGKYISVPARRVTNAPIQTSGRLQVTNRKRDLSRSLKETNKALPQPVIKENEGHALVEVLRGSQKSSRSSGLSLETDTSHDKSSRDVSVVNMEPDLGTDVGLLSPENKSRKEEERHYLAARNPSFVFGSRLNKHRKYSEDDSPIAKYSEAMKKSVTADIDRLQIAKRATSSRGESALSEESVDRGSNNSFDRSSVDRNEVLQYGPARQRRGTFSFRKRRSSTLTRASTQSESSSRSFQRLSLDIIRSAKSIRKKARKSESPDWACKTSLDIEAGRNSMSSEQSQDSESPRHIAEAMIDPIDSMFPDKRRQNIGSGEKREVHPSTSSKYSVDPFATGRHSEGALPAAQKASVDCQMGEPVESTKRVTEELLRRYKTKAASAIDLNKSLPALPSQENDKQVDKRSRCRGRNQAGRT